MTTDANYVMERGIQCLMKELGPVNTAKFIVSIQANDFDYTEWRKNYFENISTDDYNNAAIEFDKKHPFVGKAIYI